MKITFAFLLLILFLSCKKEIVNDLQGPRQLLTKDIYLNCEAFNPAESDFISFDLNSATHCIVIERPTGTAAGCNLFTSYDDKSNFSWHQISLCSYNFYNGHNTNLLFYLSTDNLAENIKDLSIGDYQFYQSGTTIIPSENFFKIRLVAASDALIRNSKPNFIYSIIDNFDSETVSQDEESYMRITEIETLQQGNIELTRLHFEFACNLQDQMGRNIQINNGSAAISLRLK